MEGFHGRKRHQLHSHCSILCSPVQRLQRLQAGKLIFSSSGVVFILISCEWIACWIFRRTGQGGRTKRESGAVNFVRVGGVGMERIDRSGRVWQKDMVRARTWGILDEDNGQKAPSDPSS